MKLTPNEFDSNRTGTDSRSKIARVLVIAGSDSGGGAGIQADIKTITMLGGHAMTAVTAITAQNTQGVTGVHPVPAEMVLAQIDAVTSDIGIDAVKIGMIGSAFTAEIIAERLRAFDGIPIVFDPVMVATSGASLADDATVAAFGKLMDVATITTPNLPELRRLTGEEDPVSGALNLVGKHGCSVLIKGGHEEEGEALADVLIETDNITTWQGQRIDTTSTHGTGCTLASAIAMHLGRGASLTDAVAGAREFVRVALFAAPGLGEGSGPMGQGDVRLDAGPPGAPRLNQVTVTVNDYAKSVQFYRALGLRQIVDSAENAYARFETAGGATLSIQADADETISPTTAIYLEIDDLDAQVERLARMGVPFEHGPRNQPWMWREARLRDPSGNTIFLYKAGEARRFPPWRVEE